MSEHQKPRKREIVRNIFTGRDRSQRHHALPSRPITTPTPQAKPTATTSSSAQRSRLSFTGRFSEAALSSLNQDEQDAVRRHLAENAGDTSDTIQKAYHAALAQRRECENKRWRLNFRGHEIVLYDQASKLVGLIERFKSAGDVVANVDPIHVGLPWAGIRMILELAITDRHQTAALLGGMNLAMYMVNRLQAYFAYKAHIPPTSTSATFEKTLLKMYVVVLRFFDSAIETYQQGLVTRTWKALWAESDLDKFESTCQNWAKQVDIDANNCERELSQQERDVARKWRELILTPALEHITSVVSEVLSGQQAAEHRSIIGWLSPPDPSSNHEAARKKFAPDTGEWVFQSPQYERWQTSERSLLWLTGRAGCGKTILCSTVIEAIRLQIANKPETQLAYFYFSFSDKQKQSHANLISSLVAQLSRSKAVCDKIKLLYDGLYPNRPSVKALEDVLSTCLQQGQTILVLDALDELPEGGDIDENDGRPAVLEWLDRVMHRSYQLRVFVTSRQLTDIEESVTSLGARYLLLQPELANNDIQIYVTTELENDQKLRRFSIDVREKIKEVLLQKSDGMFRWTACQLHELKRLKLTGPKHIEEALHNLPPTLDATYERMLLQIDDRFHDEAVRALRWLAFQSRPLTVCELAEACLIDYTSENLVDVDSRGQADEILELLAGLVTTELPGLLRQDEGPSCDIEAEASHRPSVSVKSRVRLAHFSVKEYLVSNRIAKSNSKAATFALGDDRGHHILAQSCLAYMLHYSRSSSKTSSRKDLTAFPFLKYAAKAWTAHISKHELSQPAYELLLLQSDECRKDWLAVSQPEMDWLWVPIEYQKPKTIGSPLYYTSLLGLVAACQTLIEQGADVRAQGGEYDTALQAAAYRGQYPVVRLLLDAGADVNVQGGKYGTALKAAAYRGYYDVVKLLLDVGADVNAQGGKYGTALQAASYYGYYDVVKLLLDVGVDVNVQGGEYGTALQAASYCGHYINIEIVMNARADPNALGAEHGGAHQAVSCSGHYDIVKLLLYAGADVNVQGGKYGTALQAASHRGNYDVVKLLLDVGADVNMAEAEYGTALLAASSRGHWEVVELLLNTGTIRDLQEDGSSLLAAASHGWCEIVRLLVNAGADVNAKRDGDSALHIAAIEGHEDVVRQLLVVQADATCQDRFGWTPWMVASAYGYTSISNLLLQDNKGPSAARVLSELTPSSLVSMGDSSRVAISKRGLAIVVSSENIAHTAFDEGVQCRADHPVPFGSDVFYFEVTITRSSSESIVGLGVCAESAATRRMPGWDQGSWGYHGDDGMFFDQHGGGENYGPTYTTGDVVGCGVDGMPKSLFFTKNGQHLGEATSGIRSRLFAVIGFRTNDVEISVNFGSLPFQYKAR